MKRRPLPAALGFNGPYVTRAWSRAVFRQCTAESTRIGYAGPAGGRFARMRAAASAVLTKYWRALNRSTNP